MPDSALTAFEELYTIIKRLRAPDGCEWDRKQTEETVKDYILEEAYELLEAVIGGNPADVGEECGDLTFLILFLVYIHEQKGELTLFDVLARINAKMIRRHPHVFGDEKVDGVQDILDNWEKIKAAEPDKQKRESRLDGVPIHLPALSRALAMQKKAAKAGFDWPDESGIIGKIREETDELEAELAGGTRKMQEEELGDLLFSLVNLARHRGLDPESALTATNRKFNIRFREVEAGAVRSGKALESMSLEEMDALWEAAKRSSVGDETDPERRKES